MSFTGSVVLGVQALNNSNNQVVFNKLVTGLLNAAVTEATIQELNIANVSRAIFPAGNRSGVYIKNNAVLGANDVVSVSWVNPNGSVSAVDVTELAAQGCILVFNATSGTNALNSLSLISTNAAGTPVEVAWWI